MTTERIRESVIAGSWYPGDADTLRQTIRSYLDKVPDPSAPGRLMALISPHAGYVYSGHVAAYAYKFLEKQTFDSVVVIAPSHRARFEGVSVYDKGGYRTPLGIVPLDTELIDALKKRENRIRYVPQAHSQEHSLEIQLPFLQVLVPNIRLVPLVMGDQNFSTCKWLAEAIADTIRSRSVLIVASSDLSHFHSGDIARKIDSVVLEKIGAFDPEGLSQRLAKGDAEACGGGPMIAAMIAARILGATRAEVIRYAHSGDVTGDNHRVVGYMAAAIWNNPGKEMKKDEQPTETSIDSELTSEEKAYLKRVASETIEARLQGKQTPVFEPITPTMTEPRGAFVTIHKHGQLRGCIGHMIAHYPLIETVSKMAIAAAFEDPRFKPVDSSEFSELDFEISVLTPMKKISDVSEIEVGKHGIYIKKGYASGVLLPQVATEHGWDRDTFLEHTCRKAGLPLNAWKEKGVDIYIFSADIF
jgi:AmmeMemoRadiSam system protein B/AmmeMemoRadiSam system protein A